MSVTATIGGVEYGVIPGSIQPENRVDDRDTLTLNVLDVAGTTLFQKYQPVVLTDSILGTIFTGIINTPTMQQILWPANQKIWQLQCVDQAYRLDKELSNWTYKDQYGGTILAHQLQTYSAADHVSAEFALRWEELLSAWQQGTLSGTLATTNTSTGNPGSGDLELSLAGSQVTFSQVTQADFNAGHTGGGLSSPVTGGVTFTPTQAIKFTATEALPGVTNPSLSMKIWSGSHTIAMADVLLFDVWIADSSPQQMASVDLVLSDGTKLSASQATIGVDAQGVGPAITTDLAGLATNQWYARRFFLDGGGAWVGKTINYATVSFGGSNQGNYTAYFRNIRIQNGSAITIIFDTTATATQTMPQPVQNNGYNTISCTVVTSYERHGYMYSPAFSLSNAGIVQSSFLNWSITLPDSNFSYSITATLDGHATHDGRATFLPCTLNGAIPGLLPGMSLSGKSVQFVYVFDNAGNNPTLTPFLSSITGTIIPSYACTKSDIVSTTTTTWSSGTLTNLNTNSKNALQLNGYSRNYDDADYSNQTLYGSASPAQGILKKQFFLTSDTGTDVRSRLDFAGSAWQNFTMETDVTLLSGDASVGVVYRTTNWGNSNDSYAYDASFRTSGMTLAHGTNSSGSGSATVIATTSGITFSAGTTYRLKVVVNETSHQIYLNDVLYINATDATYTSGGYVGLRFYNNMGSTQTVVFDNVGVMASLSGTWVSPVIDIHSLGSISNSQIMLQIDPAVNTSIVTFLTEISLDNGTTWATCTNDLATPVVLTQGYFQTLPVPGLSPGTNVSSMTQVKLRLTISASTASVGSFDGLLWADLTAISLFVIGAYSSTGTRSTAPLAWDSMIRGNVSGGFGTATNGATYTQTGTGTVALTSDEATISNTTGDVHMQISGASGIDEDTTLRFQLSASTMSAGVELRYVDSNNFYRLEATQNSLSILAYVRGVAWTLVTVTPTISTGMFYRLRFRVAGSGPINLYGRVWLDGTNEPTAWNVTFTQ